MLPFISEEYVLWITHSLVAALLFYFQSLKKCDILLCPKGFDKEFIVIQTDFPPQEAVVSISPVLPVFFFFVFDFISLTVMGLVVIPCCLSSVGFASSGLLAL